jgi:hypothetical protein
LPGEENEAKYGNAHDDQADDAHYIERDSHDHDGDNGNRQWNGSRDRASRERSLKAARPAHRVLAELLAQR